MSEETWYPQQWCWRYPDRCMPPYDGPPHYPFVPDIVVTDLTWYMGRAQRFWLKSRENALAMWAAAGLTFHVKDGTTYRKGRITIGVLPTSDGTRGEAFFGAEPPEAETPYPGRGWAHVDDDWFKVCYDGRNQAGLTKVLAHEIGHTFGFGHGGTGAMSTYATGAVDGEERLALRRYFQL